MDLKIAHLFKDKKDQADFFIAIVVIAFFGAFVLWFVNPTSINKEGNIPDSRIALNRQLDKEEYYNPITKENDPHKIRNVRIVKPLPTLSFKASLQ